MNSIGHTLYLRYKDESPCWPFIASALALCTIATVGIASNAAVIYVTIRTKKLHGTTFVLLALTSAFELVHLTGQYLFLFVAVSGQNFIDYKLAAQISTPSLFALQMISPIMLFIGIDRLISVTFVNFYKTIKSAFYIGAMLLPGALLGLYFTVATFITANGNPNVKVTGFFGDFFQGELLQPILQIGFYLNVATIAVYIVTGLTIRTNLSASATNVDQSNRRIFISICLIVFFNVGGYLVQKLCRLFIIPALFSVPITVWLAILIASIPLLISASSNAFILYLSSSTYRKAFCKEWAKLGTFFGISVPSPSNHNNKNNNQIMLQLTSMRNVNVHPIHQMGQQRM